MGVSVLFIMVLVIRYGQGYSIDHDYSPQSDERLGVRTRVTRSTITTPPPNFDANIKKCRCDGNHAWNGSVCIEAETYKTVTNLTTNRAITEVNCSDDRESKTILRPSNGISYEFPLLSNGSLYWQGRAFDNYCFDHIFDMNGEFTWQAEVCLPTPIIPRCCHTSSSDQSCHTATTQPFSPPVTLIDRVLQWPRGLPERSVEVKCREHESLVTVSLNTTQANLKYKSGIVILEWSSPNQTGRRIMANQYCVEAGMDGKQYVASVCDEDEAVTQKLCSEGICARKCCHEGDIMNQNTELCESVGKHTDWLWVPTFTDANDLQSRVQPPNDLTWLYGKPTCCNPLFIISNNHDSGDTLLLLNNGSLFHSTKTNNNTYSPTHYCLDNFMSDSPKPGMKALVWSYQQVVNPVCDAIHSKVYPALLVVSSVFLGVALMVYMSLPVIRDTLHGRCLLSLMAALFVAYILYATTSLALHKLTPALCSSFASLTHLSILAAFFWLNVMCFDIWRTLRNTRIAVNRGWEAKRRFLAYSLYAWGVPLLITVAAVSAEYSPSTPGIIQPNFGPKCWFQTVLPHWLYLYGWILAIVLANLVFFLLVAAILCKAQNQSLLRVNQEYNRERMLLCIKLFLVMGITWIAEIISYHSNGSSCRAFVVTDIINTLQGFFIFLVFVCKKSTLKLVMAKCGYRSDKVGSRLTTLYSISPSKSRRQRMTMQDSPNSKRSSASPKVMNKDADSPLLLQTLKRTLSDDSSDLPHVNGKRLHDTDPMAKETTPLPTHSTTPQRHLETHFDT